MKLLKDLLSLKPSETTTVVSEERDRFEDLSDAINYAIDKDRLYSLEGERGVDNLETLVTEWLGYDSLEDFFYDNSGALEAVVDWIGNTNNEEWKKQIQRKADADFMDSLRDDSPDHSDIKPNSDILVMLPDDTFTAWQEGNKDEVFINADGVETVLFNVKTRTFTVPHDGRKADEDEINTIRSNPGYRQLLLKLKDLN